MMMDFRTLHYCIYLLDSELTMFAFKDFGATAWSRTRHYSLINEKQQLRYVNNDILFVLH